MKKQRKQTRDIHSILSNPVDKQKLHGYIDETVLCKQRIMDEQESIRGLRDTAVEELGIEPKLFNQLVSLFVNNSFDEKLQELEKLEAAIEALKNRAPGQEA
jgi:hypothetical protein